MEELIGYVRSGMTAKSAAAILGISRSAAISRARRAGAPFRSKHYIERKFKKAEPAQSSIATWAAPLVPLLELRHDQCHFPVGDPTTKCFGYCGRKRMPGSSYCADCHKVCHRAVLSV